MVRQSLFPPALQADNRSGGFRSLHADSTTTQSYLSRIPPADIDWESMDWQWTKINQFCRFPSLLLCHKAPLIAATDTLEAETVPSAHGT